MAHMDVGPLDWRGGRPDGSLTGDSSSDSYKNVSTASFKVAGIRVSVLASGLYRHPKRIRTWRKRSSQKRLVSGAL